MINKDNLQYFAATNRELIKGGIKAVVIEFPGMDGGSCLGGQTRVGELRSGYAIRCAQRGILLVYPFVGPWSWMNDVAVKTVDMVIDAVKESYGLPDDIRIVNSGGSMGGTGALMYTALGKHRAAACAANGPVCDLTRLHEDFHDGVCSVYRAVAHYEMPYGEAVKSISPLYRTDDMPWIPYFIAHTGGDTIVPIEKNSEPFVAKMRALGHVLEYIAVPDQAHCDIGPEAQARFENFVFGHALGEI